MTEIEEKIIGLRKTLNAIKEIVNVNYKKLKVAREIAEEALTEYNVSVSTYNLIDTKLAELDGRLKIIEPGKSGVKKVKADSLTPAQAERLYNKLKGMMK